jgi:tripartite-type tricarboxylate transporter receptor subunit TctC
MSTSGRQMDKVTKFKPGLTWVLGIAFACAAAAPVPQAQAQSGPAWPTRPIRLIVPTGAGAATDIMARLLANGIGDRLGQPVVVENMPGASGLLAHQFVARAQPDGHTFLFTNTSGMSINLVSFKSLPYDPGRDFTAVAMVCSLGPQMLSANAELPVKTVADFFDYARANRGKLSIGFDNTAGAAAFAAKLLNRRADLGLVEVPYRASAQMTQDTASGVVQVMMSSIAAARAMVDAGRLRQLAVTSASRFPALPDLPAVREIAPGVVMNGWFAVVAPAATPSNVVARLNREIAEFLKGQDIQQRLYSFGLATEGAGTPESTALFIRRDQEQWRALAAELDIQPQ